MWGSTARRASPTSTATATSTPSWERATASCAISRTPASALAPAFTEQTGLANPFNGVDVGDSSTPSLVDLDRDGDLDAVVGTGDGILRYFENTGSALAPAFTEQTGTDNPFNGLDVGLNSTPSFADLDRDGDLDAVVGESNGILRYFENTGSAIAPAFTERTGAANPLNGIDVGLFSAPTFTDLDRDGDLDAVVGENGGSLKYFENTGAGFALVVNVTAQNDAAVPDFSSDSKSDILWQSGSGTAAAWLMNGTSSTSVGAIGSFNPGPAWHIKATGDFNGDSKSDIVWQGDNGARRALAAGRHQCHVCGASRPVQSGAELARSRTPATSTATASPTSSGRMTTALPRCG